MLGVLLNLLIKLYGGVSERLTSVVTLTTKALKPSFAGTPGGGTRLKSFSVKRVSWSPMVNWIVPTCELGGQAGPVCVSGSTPRKSAVEQRVAAVGEPMKPGGTVIVRSFSASSGISPIPAISGSGLVLTARLSLTAK